MKPVVVFGATGYTGRLVVSALLDLGVDDIVLGGRDEEKLEALAKEHGGLVHRVADALDPDTLGPLTRGAHVVISTAGPFTRFGEPVVRAALASGAHFLDTTGEQAYMARILERYHGPAKRKRLAVVNAQAFEFALGHCAARLLCDWDPALERVDVFNRTYGTGATRGTQKSALDQLAEVGLVRRGGRLVPRGPSPRPEWVTWPDSHEREPAVPFPGGEALHLGHSHPEIRDVATHLALPPKLAVTAMAAWAARPLVAPLGELGALDFLHRWIDAGPEGPPASARRTQGFKVLARGRARGTERSVLVKGNDPYGITGVIAALGAKMLLDGPPESAGVVSTDRAFGARRFLDALARYGVSVSRHDE
jgi:short subunit dehydrogenase-like uncharacterized protein